MLIWGRYWYVATLLLFKTTLKNYALRHKCLIVDGRGPLMGELLGASRNVLGCILLPLRKCLAVGEISRFYSTP
jgi:hypothetical protein